MQPWLVAPHYALINCFDSHETTSKLLSGHSTPTKIITALDFVLAQQLRTGNATRGAEYHDAPSPLRKNEETSYRVFRNGALAILLWFCLHPDIL